MPNVAACHGVKDVEDHDQSHARPHQDFYEEGVNPGAEKIAQVEAVGASRVVADGHGFPGRAFEKRRIVGYGKFRGMLLACLVGPCQRVGRRGDEENRAARDRLLIDVGGLDDGLSFGPFVVAAEALPDFDEHDAPSVPQRATAANSGDGKIEVDRWR